MVLARQGQPPGAIRYTAGMRQSSAKATRIRRLFRSLEGAMGRQHWWPAGSPFEVIVGAYLTQNTAWTNVEQAMTNLRAAGILSISGIRHTPLDELEGLVRPAGYFRQKAARLKRFVAHLDANYGGSLEQMFARPTEALRDELLGLPGIGPETADSILLYAANREVFVVDNYTRRIFERHELAEPAAPYEEIRLAVQSAITEADLPAKPRGRPRQPQPTQLAAAQPELHREDRPLPHPPSAASAMERTELSQRYNEFHALLVQTAKHYCVKGKPRCERCPLRAMLEGKTIPPG